MLAIPQGACCARKRPAKDGPGENRFTTWSFKPLKTHVTTFSAPFPMKNECHVAGNTGCGREHGVPMLNVRMDSRGYKRTYIRRKYDYSTTQVSSVRSVGFNRPVG